MQNLGKSKSQSQHLSPVKQADNVFKVPETAPVLKCLKTTDIVELCAHLIINASNYVQTERDCEFVQVNGAFRHRVRVRK